MGVFSGFTGNWEGKNRLFLAWPPDPEYVSMATLVAVEEALGRGLRLSYTWGHQGKYHEGVLFLVPDQSDRTPKGSDGNGGGPGMAPDGLDGGAPATGAWVDSFHQGSSVMYLKGRVHQDGSYAVSGSYAAPPDPDWGWRIEVRLTEEGDLELGMTNIAPDGEEFPAVKATFSRTSPP